MKKKTNELMKNAKDTIKLGVISQAGMGAMGAMTSVPGMPAQASNIAGVAGAGLTLANVGQLAKTGMSLTKLMKISSKNKKKYY